MTHAQIYYFVALKQITRESLIIIAEPTKKREQQINKKRITFLQKDATLCTNNKIFRIED